MSAPPCKCGCGTPTPWMPKNARYAIYADGHNPRRPRPRAERFWEKVDKAGPNGCWLWTASLNEHGYGYFGRGRGVTGVTTKAHRVAYELVVGPLPEGMVLDHICSVRSCVNPAHLEPVTQRENLRRSPVVITTVYAARTKCARGHEFTGENLIVRDGVRVCRACQRARDVGRVR